MSLKNNFIVDYLKKSYQELEKVTWLTPKQMVQSSIIVIVMTVFVTVFLTIVDYLFHQGYIALIDNIMIR